MYFLHVFFTNIFAIFLKLRNLSRPQKICIYFKNSKIQQTFKKITKSFSGRQLLNKKEAF